jgi:hypothetical protein
MDRNRETEPRENPRGDYRARNGGQGRRSEIEDDEDRHPHGDVRSAGPRQADRDAFGDDTDRPLSHGTTVRWIGQPMGSPFAVGGQLGATARSLGSEALARSFGEYSTPQLESHRGKGPRGYVRSDERIAEEVNERLTDDDRLDATEIECRVANGEVTLSGTVRTRNCKRHAEDLALAVRGVVDVENRLRVETPRSRSGRR